MNIENNNTTDSLTDFFGEVIYSYTRRQALEDGNLVDVTETAREAGFKLPVALTRALWDVIETIPAKAHLQDWEGRLWDCLWMGALAARCNPGVSQINYRLMLAVQGDRRRYQTLRLEIGPGDEGEPVFTLDFPADF